MQVTLRKAARLLSQVDAKLSELNGRLYETSSKSVFVADNQDDIRRRLAETRDTGLALLTSVQLLTDARTTLRGLVGAANATNGINDLVTVLKGTELKLNTVRALRNRVGTEPALDERELGVRLTALTTARDAGAATVNRYLTRGEDNQSFNVYTQTDLDAFSTFEKSLAKKMESTQDQIERINNTVSFEVSADVEKVLQQTNVL